MITLDSPWRRLGAFPIATWRDEFRRVGSPMLPDADACVEAAGPHGALALAQAFVEDKYATTGSKPQAKNPLNLRPGPGRMTPTVTVPGKGEFLVFDAYADCFREWRRRLFDEAETYKAPPGGRGPYALAGEGILDLIADAYCPKGPPGTPEFANDPEAYARSLVTMLDRLNAPLLDQVDDDQDAPAAGIVFGRVPRPSIVDKTIGDKILPNGDTNGYNLLGTRKGLLVGTCLHRMHGNLQGTFDHFSRVDIGALTDYGVGGVLDPERDGQIWQYNDPEGERTPWANGVGPGEGSSDDPAGIAFKRAFANEMNQGLIPHNRRLVSIETSGFLPDHDHTESEVTDAQVDSLAHLVAFWQDRIGVPWNVFPNHPTLGIKTLYFHDSFSTKNCPGQKLHARTDEIIEKARAIMRQHQGGHGVVAATITDPTKIEGIDAALLKRWFGKVKAEDGQTIQYDPADPVAKLWGTAGATSGEFPAITEVQVFTDSPQQTRRYTRFGDGLTVFQTTGAKPTLLQGNGAGFPTGMDAGLAECWFGKATAEDGQVVRFDQSDAVCALWLRNGSATGHYPTLVEVEVFEDSPSQTRRYYRFAGGLTIFQPTSEKPRLLHDGGEAFPAGMDAGLARRWFGEGPSENGHTLHFQQGDPASSLWLGAGIESGQFPAVAEVQVFKDSPQQTRRYTRFADGLTIFETTGESARILRG